MNSKPIISVCVPTYNYGRFLNRCIESVQQQSFTKWELVICDDCSTDETQELVQKYQSMDSRIRYIRNDSRLGMNANLRKVAGFAQGTYLKILCSDDWLAESCLETFHNLMETNPHVALATSAEIYCDEKGNPLRTQFLFKKPVSIFSGDQMLDRMALGSGFGGNSSFFIRGSAYLKVGGYDAELLYAADLELAARLSRVGDYLHTDTPLFYGRGHSASSSALDPKKLYDVQDYYEIPRKVFLPRFIGNREWLRYQIYTGRITSRYLLNVLIEHFRGHRAYARSLGRILSTKGNFIFGVPYFPIHILLRIGGCLFRKQNELSRHVCHEVDCSAPAIGKRAGHGGKK